MHSWSEVPIFQPLRFVLVLPYVKQSWSQLCSGNNKCMHEINSRNLVSNTWTGFAGAWYWEFASIKFCVFAGQFRRSCLSVVILHISCRILGQNLTTKHRFEQSLWYEALIKKTHMNFGWCRPQKGSGDFSRDFFVIFRDFSWFCDFVCGFVCELYKALNEIPNETSLECAFAWFLCLSLALSVFGRIRLSALYVVCVCEKVCRSANQ